MSMNSETIEKIRTLLRNEKCQSIENKGGFLQIDFSKCHLSVGCAWRIITNKNLIGSASKPEEAEEYLKKLLEGIVIKDVTLNGEFNDLYIEFENDLTLETFADSNNYEHWTLSGLNTEMIISGPGNLWSAF